MKIQQILIDKLLEPLASLMGKINPKIRKTVSMACVLGFIVIFICVGTYLFPARYLVFFAIGCAMLALLILCTLEKGIKPVKWDKFLGICWIAICALMFYSAFANNTDYLADPLIYLIIPIAFIVWNRYGLVNFTKLLINCTIITFGAYVVITALMYPIQSLRYSGIFANPNDTAGYLVAVIACILIEMLNIKKIDVKAIFLYILMGLGITLLYYSGSRTGEISAILCVFITIMVYIIGHKHELKHLFLHCVVPMIISAAILLPTTLYIYKACNIGSFKSGESPITLEDIYQDSDKRGDTSGKTLDRYLSGRVSIWEEFSKHVKLFGNGEREDFYVANRKRSYPTAHNVFMEYAFKYGLICAVVFFIYVAWSGIKSVGFAIKNNENVYSLFPMAMAILFFGEAMMESINEPFMHIVTLFYMFIQFPLVIKKMPGEVKTN